MNVIFVLIDSCNRHYLSPYGCKSVKTPNIGQLASRGVTFTNHMIGSAPCMPARREMMTGRREFLWRGWGHIEPFDRPIAFRCREEDVTAQMVTDHYHYWETGGHGYIEYFDGCEMIRGHEMDYWKTEDVSDQPDWVNAIDKWRTGWGTGLYRHGWGTCYYRNVAHFKSEEDFFSPTVFRKAAEWLEANHTQDRFFLQIESFDAHEPFHVPEPYRSMYTQDLDPSYTCWPPYQKQEQRTDFLRGTSMGELAYIRAQYQGKLTMVDTALGQVWSVMDKHNLWDNTVVILTTDHGHELAEAIHDLGEVTDDGRDSTMRVPFGKHHPHYLSHANIPLIVWHPRLMNGGKRIDDLTCTVDMYPTVLDALGMKDTSSPHGMSLLPLLAGKKSSRDLVYWGTFGEGICCTDGEHVLLQGANCEAPLYWYSALMDRTCSPQSEAGQFIPGVECPVWRVPRTSTFDFPSILYRRDDSIFAERNILSEKPEVASVLRKRLKEVITEDGCPPEQFDRLGL